MFFFLEKYMNTLLSDASKFLSYVLRHRPDAIGISLDAEGWADISALIAAAIAAGKQLDHALIQTVVATCDKKRFAISEDGLRIRAVQGHSTASVRTGTAVPAAMVQARIEGTAASGITTKGRSVRRSPGRALLVPPRCAIP